jgi:general secretion pathway protein A
VLIIDEAQNLAIEVLEQLRLLTNLETSERKLLQIILIGQPELREMLAGPGLEALAQRVIARYHLGALTATETAAYVVHRLAVAGRNGGLLFDAAALRAIHRRSAGVPRRINLLADRALLGAYAGGLAVVGRRAVIQAAGEVFDGRPARPQRQRLLTATLAGAVIGGLLVGAGLWLWPGARWVGAEAAAVLAQGASGVEAGAVDSSPLDAGLGLALFTQDEPAAWRELAARWGVADTALAGDDPCQPLRVQQLRCHRVSGATLAQLRQLDRPAWLLLHGDDGQVHRAGLLDLDDQRAVFAAAPQAVSLTLAQLARWWRGEFATLWRAPVGYSEALQTGARGPAVDALAQGLAALQQAPAPASGQVLVGPLAERLAAFQVAQSLRPDGIAGPTTFMHLNRAQGVDEPRLSRRPAER